MRSRCFSASPGHSCFPVTLMSGEPNSSTLVPRYFPLTQGTRARIIWLSTNCSADKDYTAGMLESKIGNKMTEVRGKTIHVSKDVHERLTERGKFKDSYNDIIRRLLDQCEIQEDSNDGQEESSA